MPSGQSEIPPVSPISRPVQPGDAETVCARPTSTLFRHGWFLACLALMTGLTIAFEYQFRHTIITKEALPLKAVLGQLDWRNKLIYQEDGKNWSYRLEGQPVQIEPEVLNRLGTDQYVGWRLRLWNDTDKHQTAQVFDLFVTYYTGKPDQVPHVPEECMLGNGFAPAGSEVADLELPDLPDKDRHVPINLLMFRRERSTMAVGEECALVMYTFRVCDQWHADRDRVRLTLGDRHARYAYFSKVEVSFPLPPGMPPEAVEKATEAGKRFLRVLLPVLVQDHWPNWPSNDGQSAPAAGGETGQPQTAPAS